MRKRHPPRRSTYGYDGYGKQWHKVIAGGGGGGGGPVSDWIVRAGNWDDSGFWRDGENWID